MRNVHENENDVLFLPPSVSFISFWARRVAWRRAREMASEMLSRVLRSEPTFEIQLVCVALLSAVVYVFLLLCNEIVSRLTKDKEYIPTVIQVGKHKLKGMLGVDASDELSLQFWYGRSTYREA